MTAEDKNLDMLLSLFEESQGDEPENSSSNEREDNLDGLFDEDDVDDEDGEGYVEPEEEEEATLEKSSTDAEKEHNRSKEDLEAIDMSKRLTRDERIEIVLISGERSNRVIAADFNARHPTRPPISHATVSKLLAKFRETGSGLTD